MNIQTGRSILTASLPDICSESVHLRLVLESCRDGVLLVDSAGAIARANRAADAIFGYAGGKMAGQPIDTVLPEWAATLAIATTCPAYGEDPGSPTLRARSETTGRRADGSPIGVEVCVNAAAAGSEPVVVVLVSDVTNRRREEELLRAVEEGVEFDRLVADIAATFVNVDPEHVDHAIVAAQARIVEALDVDCSVVYQVGDAADTLTLTHQHARFDWMRIPRTIAAAQYPWSWERIRNGSVASFKALREVPDPIECARTRSYGTHSRIALPLRIDGRFCGTLVFASIRRERSWPAAAVGRLELIAQVFASALAARQARRALQDSMQEVQRLKDQLHTENVHLRREVQERAAMAPVVGRSHAVRRVLEQVEQVAATDSTVLLLGETGTGKELFATLIHERSGRRNRPMVRVNCAAIPATLIESELFGREKGAFTGALSRQVGRFELADHSTIFLDEIGDLPPDVQVKLLRVLEERQIERLGSPRSIRVDTRIIAATHRNLEQRIADGGFREDLFYRLNVFPIQVPPLRERAEDIPDLVWRFVEEFAKSFGKRISEIPRDNITALQQYAWPGNIRELRNVVERAMIVSTGDRLSIPIPASPRAEGRPRVHLVEFEREHIRNVLESTGWRVRGAGGAADRLGLKPTTLETRMAKLGISRPRPS